MLIKVVFLTCLILHSAFIFRTSHRLVYKRYTSRSHQDYFIPYPATKTFHIPHPALIFCPIPHSAKPIMDPLRLFVPSYFLEIKFYILVPRNGQAKKSNATLSFRCLEVCLSLMWSEFPTSFLVVINQIMC